jgi:O-methyltransferase involved in polyketide biosynthesis
VPDIANNQQLGWAIRAYNFDLIVKKFLEQYEKVTVINIGAGLDTTFQRIDNGSVRWINIDLPAVMALRFKLIPASAREMNIGKSVFDFSWIDDIAHLTEKSTVLFMTTGILFYFDKDEVKPLFLKLSSIYSGAHFVFGAISSGLWVALSNWAS